MKFRILFFLLFIAGNVDGAGKRLTCESTDSAQITLKLEGNITLDSVVLTLWGENYMPMLDRFISPEAYTFPLQNGLCVLRFPMGDFPKFFSLRRINEARPFINYFLVEKEDNVQLFAKDGNLVIMGKGSAKYECAYALSRNYSTTSDSLDRAGEDRVRNLRADTVNTPLNMVKYYFEKAAILRDFQVSLLAQYKSKLNPVSYGCLLASVYGQTQEQPISAAQFYFINQNLKKSNENMDSVGSYIKAYSTSPFDWSDRSALASPEFVNYFYQKIQLEAYTAGETMLNWVEKVQPVKAPLRDKLLTMWVCNGLLYIHNVDSIITKILPEIKDEDYTQVLTNLKKIVRPGVEVHEFALPDSTGKLVRLSDFRGKLVFIDFWFTGCGPCKQYYQYCLSAVEKKYKDNPNIVFITISADKDRDKWLRSKNNGYYTSSDVVNLYTDGKGFFHEILESYKIDRYPTQKLIDRQGRLISNNSYELGGGARPNPAKLIETIEKHLTSNLPDATAR